MLGDGLARGFQCLPRRQATLDHQRNGQQVGNGQVDARDQQQDHAEIDQQHHHHGSDDQRYGAPEVAENLVEAQWLVGGATNADHVDAGHEGVGQGRGQQRDEDFTDDHQQHVFAQGAEDADDAAEDEGGGQQHHVEHQETTDDDAFGALDLAPGFAQ